MMILLSFSALAQKKVAVMEVKTYEGVKPMHAIMIRGGLETAVGNTNGYEVYDRSNFESIMQEHNFQRSGAVKDSEIKRLGEMAGVQYIIVPEAIAEGSEIYINVKMLDVETGKFGGVHDVLCAATSHDIQQACAELGAKLFGYASNTVPVKKKEETPVNTKPTNVGVDKDVFTVSKDKKVRFSKGNLQYQASTNTWRFAESQLDYIGDDNKKISKKYSGWIDLFVWGSGDNPTKKSNKITDYSITFKDWGQNTISNGGGKKWFTLSSQEWRYLLDTRNTKTGIRYARAEVNGVRGIILLPDNWDKSYYELNDTDKFRSEYYSNKISLSDWLAKLEANGAVFLPAAGIREGSEVRVAGFCGNYWSSTWNSSTKAFRMSFGTDMILGNDDFFYYGCSVRLVSYVK